MQIAYIPFGVIRPLLNGFWRTHSPKYASERVYTIGVNAGYLIIGDRQRRDAKNARVAYIPQDANVNSEGTHPAGEGACRSTAFF